MLRQTGTSWDSAKGTIKMDDDWWAKARKDIPGCGKFRRLGIQNEDQLRASFGNIISDGGDHWSPMGENVVVPPSKAANETDDDAQEEANNGDEEEV
uniref:Myb/SANT-like domain-containing protein n=1 Tax=Arundo donax TaxID=35708 RepID=A0A0A9FTX1_ARUDO